MALHHGIGLRTEPLPWQQPRPAPRPKRPRICGGTARCKGKDHNAPNMTAGIRERIWEVVSGCHYELGNGSIVMTWRDPTSPGEQEVRTLGESPKELVDADGVYLVKYR